MAVTGKKELLFSPIKYPNEIEVKQAMNELPVLFMRNNDIINIYE